ncbi:hypothetical protein PAHAL_1G259400 [Panicum hallii]|uniref:Uncharacterized protein n=1 Tax=Panicum hallii TaxID=206008 RepID=A0A2S3GQ50_9POAL|nr:uncharacterized protein LOC112879999 [Panicum hallii]XP_025800236.1 uncharacterized protein LOC112879999 [Panicum hallii]XP_025800242.1 uncharacterized protein LOC112879999 [Panicum hallii]PAN06370.1 hypothetical protein PAHAL_1G259400 [Panicum hallii]PAN06371.1 hypothetical protein PAHAL_1G259400 [Panicum hallii]
MSSLDFDGRDDIFFDVSDDIRSSTYSTARCSISDQLSASWRPEYELWTSEPMSVNERRHRFLIGMGLVQPIPTGISFSQWQGDTLPDRAFRDLEERISSICSSYQSSFSHCAPAPDSAYCTRDLGTGNRVVVHENEHDGLTGILEEVGTDKIMNINQSEGFLSFSQLVNEFLRKGGGRSHVRGANITATDKQKDPKSFCGRFTRKKAEDRICMYDAPMNSLKTSTFSRTKVDQQNKKWMDFSAVYMCQEIQAHGGSIRVMKFSPSGWYLASVGEDCIVRIWMIQEVESSPDLYGREAPVEYMDRNKGLKMKVGKGWRRTLAIIPKKVFNIAETPLHEFHGHTSDILDMTWSKSDFLLTSSKDKTVRMWKVGCDGCLAVFKHRDYVTCVQFNPVDERYFVSGSIDGKVRVWDVSEKRVVDWADTRDIISAVSYQPDAKGLIVGTVAGRCRFYDQSGENMEVEKELKVTKKKSASSQITSLQFSRGDPAGIVIASAGPKIRVSEGADISRKFEGRRGSKALAPPSLTSDGRYLVSAGADSNVYIWNFDKLRGKSAKGARTVRSCEHFFSEGVTSVATWPGLLHQEGCAGGLQSSEKGPTLCRDRDCCSFGAWFFADGMGGAATWPEEKLLPSLKYVNCGGVDERRPKVPAAWNTVVVTGGRDGVIRCFHNYGLPVKL